MGFLYQQLLFRPLFNLLVFIYNILPGADFGLAIIILTLIIRLIFVPLSVKSLISQKELNKLHPKIKELQEKYKNDRQALGQATMALYKQYNINPFSGCLPMLIQIPVLLALYKALSSGFKPENLNLLYSFITNPGFIKEISLGFINLAHRSVPMTLIAGFLQWLQLKQATAFQKPVTDEAESPAFKMNKQMLYFFPMMIIIIGWNLPAGLVLYWVVTTGFSLFEQSYINKRYNNRQNLNG